jgi:type IX secretion system substrate protein/carboxypeptidase family protein
MKPTKNHLLIVLTIIITSTLYGQSFNTINEKQELAETIINHGNQGIEQIKEIDIITDNRSGSSFVEIGNGNGFGEFPSYFADWSNFYDNCRTQTLYLATDFPCPVIIKELQYSFEQFATPDNWLEDVEIRIFETSHNELISGEFYDTIGSTLVWSSANYIPATATGWADVIDINDYSYSTINNLIIDIVWGDNGYNVPVFHRTHRTDASATRVLIGNSDSYYSLDYDYSSNWYSNIRFYWDPIIPFGAIEGIVVDGAGIPIPDATMEIDGWGQTFSDAMGYYSLSDLPVGNNDVVYSKEGYNIITDIVYVVSGGVVNHDFTLTQPNFSYDPTSYDINLSPNEYLTQSLELLNSGDGDGEWNATIIQTNPVLTCDMQVALFDSNGDGWNGGLLTILVNNIPVLSDITLTNGYGPEYFTFQVNGGDNLSTIYTEGDSSFENLYEFLNDDGLIYSSENSSIPEGLIFGICPKEWILLSENSGTITGGDSQSIDVGFSALNMVEGDQLSADIVFALDPNIGTPIIPVTLTVTGDSMCLVTDLEVELLNMITGQWDLTWMYTPSCPDFEYFIVKRDGVILGTTVEIFYSDVIPDYGSYCFTVIPVFSGGEGIPISTCIDWYEPELCWSPNVIYNELWLESQESITLTIENCDGDTLDFVFPDYGSGFITNIYPESGQVPGGQTMDISLTFNASGYTTGLFDEWLVIETNDPNNMQDSIFNQMLIYNSGVFYGTVTDTITGDSMFGVYVSAGDFNTQTDTSGYYELEVDAGNYDICFSLLGFEATCIVDAVVVAENVNEENVAMFVIPNPVSWVIADENEAGTQCMVAWTLPRGLNEILYDDSEANDFVIWTTPGNAVGVCFTPKSYPATITGGRLNVGDGSFPEGSNFLGTQLAIGIMDDDGVSGLPGTILDSVVFVVSNYGWINFNDVFDNTFMEGDFYLVVWQLGDETNSAPIAADTNLPAFSNSVILEQGLGWSELPDKDFMIRAHVNSSYYFNNYMSDYYTNYTIARITDFDPVMGPETGTFVPIANPINEIYNDFAYGACPEGFIAYAIKTIYQHGQSIWTYSNIVNHGNENTVNFELMHCLDSLPDGIEVTLAGLEYPYQNFYAVADTSGLIVFDSVVDGLYNLLAYKPGYSKYEHLDLGIYEDITYNIILTQIVHPPHNLIVDPLTSFATWDDPTIIKLPKERFDDVIFPPVGWQSSSTGVGWYRNNDGGSGSWAIPPGDGYFAISNDNEGGVTNNGSVDYLITPMLDLRDCPSYKINFDYFYDGSDGQSAYVEYSIDNGSTWEVMKSMDPVTEWTNTFVDLGLLSGPDSQPVWIAFHADDNGGTASGFGVDNVEVINFYIPVVGYYIYLNDIFITQVPANFTSYTFVDLIYGQTYETSVRSLKNCGLSESCNYTWESSYLHPPRNLSNNYVLTTDSVPLKWNPPMTGTIPMAATFNIVYDGPPKQKYGPTTDVAEEVTVIEFEDRSNRSMGELQFSFPDLIASGEAGCETDGEFIFTTLPDAFVKYDMDGFLIESFSIPGVSNVKDLAFDGEFFYGAAANTTVFVMDFDSHSLITTFTAPAAIRSIAFSEDDNTFYGNDWGTDIINFDASGTTLGSFTPVVSAIYGLAYDKWTIQGVPCLWAYDQGENNLIQFALPNGEPTGFVIDVNCVTCSTGLAGGLYTHPGLFEEGKVTIGGNVQDDEVWGIELTDYNTGGGLIPDGLSSFKIYQDDVHIASIPYEFQTPNEWVTYLVGPLDLGSYSFCVSAVYDLTNFGFPGDYSESQKNCGDLITVIWGFVIPFLEDWTSGTFDGWELNENSENWLINTDEGEPAPSAQFYWDPILQDDYTSTLTSEPIVLDSLTEGDIYLDFDLKLENRNATGEELLLVEIFDGNNWNQVAEYGNGGKASFERSHLNITDYTTDNTFKIRFNVTGQNSYDIESWFLDNISVTRECSPPKSLTAEYIWNASEDMGVELCWESPDSTRNYNGNFHSIGTAVDYSNNSRSMDGFNIFRKEMDSTEYVLYDFVELQQGHSSYCYFDVFPNVVVDRGYYYKVNASYSSETDFCESAFAMALEIPENDFVYVYLTDMISTEANLFNIYPNPAQDIININSPIPIKYLTITNYIGQVVYNSNTINHTNMEINSSSIRSGVYVIRIETNIGKISKKVIISK